jgi:hypothetical protein
MRQRRAKSGLNAWSLGNAKYLQAHRVAWLAALLMAASFAEGSLASGSEAGHGREQVFRLGRLAPTRAG